MVPYRHPSCAFAFRTIERPSTTIALSKSSGAAIANIASYISLFSVTRIVWILLKSYSEISSLAVVSINTQHDVVTNDFVFIYIGIKFICCSHRLSINGCYYVTS